MLVLTAGASLNVVLNQLLIPIIGIEGSAIATLLGYVVADVVLVLVLLKIKLIVINPRFIFVCTALAGYFLFWRLYASTNLLIGNLAASAFLFLCLYLYKTEILAVISTVIYKGERSIEDIDLWR